MKKKIKEIFKDKDIKKFIYYSLTRPWTIKRIKHDKIPAYLFSNLNEERKVKIDNLYIKKMPLYKKGNVVQSVFEEKFWNIHLASVDIRIDVDNIEWFAKFSDPEDTAAFHRFIWLFREVYETINDKNAEKCNAAVKKIIYSWIDSIETKQAGNLHFEIWQTYTVVERMVNWLMMLAVSEARETRDDKIIGSIIRQLKYVEENLEYYGEDFTGNHLLNDGRGLYICGALLGLDDYANMGKTIIINEYKRIVPDDFFLREGSVHYQFLVTKWLIDVFWVAMHTNDKEFANYLGNILDKLEEGCKFFLLKNNDDVLFPLIGDISPDYRPEWLCGVPAVVETLVRGKTVLPIPQCKGYHTFFLEGNTKTEISDFRPALNYSNDWGRIDNSAFTVFMHVNNSLYPNNLTGHFHHDSGGIIVYFENSPLLVDCGRTNYSLSQVATRGRDYTGHNILVVDGMNPEPNMRTFFNKAFIKYYVGEKPIVSVTNQQMTSQVFGTKRIRGLEVHTREVTLNGCGLIIKDYVKGMGNHEILILYHVPVDISIVIKQKDLLCLQVTETKTVNMQFSIKPDMLQIINGKQNMLFGHIAKEYGEDRDCNSILIKYKRSLPFNLVTSINKNM